MLTLATLVLLWPDSGAAQGVDPVLLTNRYILQVAADSRGAAVALQQVDNTVYGVYRYDSGGGLLEAFTNPDQVLDASKLSTPALLGVDSKDNVYIAAMSAAGGVVLLRPSDATPSWHPEIAGTQLDIRASAFDRQDNLLIVGIDSAIHVIKLDRDSGRVLAEYRFGGPTDSPVGIATDAAGNAYVTGWRVPVGDANQAFVVKLDPALRPQYDIGWGAPALVFPNGIAVAPDGSAYVTGGFPVGGFPTTPGAYQTSVPAGPRPLPGGTAFVTRIAPDGRSVLASTLLAGSYAEGGAKVRIDRNGNVVVIGVTQSRDFPATGVWASPCGPNRGDGAYQATFVTVLDPALSHLLSSARIPQASPRSASALLPDGSFYISLISGHRILRVSPLAPSSPVACIVNGASFVADEAVAPGQLLTIFGAGLGPDPLLAFDSAQQLPFSAGGTEVRIGGIAAPLLAVATNQINAIVPFGIAGRSQVPVEVYRDGSIIYRWQAGVVPQNPAPLLHFEPDGTVPLYQFWYKAPYLPLADAVNDDGTPNGPANPTHWGSTVTIYATGFGQLTPTLADGAPGSAAPSVFNGASFRTASGDAEVSKSYTVLSVATIPGRTNSVVAVKVQLPPFPDATVPIPVEFRLGPPGSPDDRPTHVIYAVK